MEKALQQFMEKHQLSETNGVVHGRYKGYYINVAVDRFNAPSLIVVVHGNIADNAVSLLSYLENTHKENHIFSYDVTKEGLFMGFAELSIAKSINYMESNLDTIIEKLAGLNISGADYCVVCGKPMDGDTEVVQYNGPLVEIHSHCKDAMNESLKKEEEDIVAMRKAEKEALDSMPNNYGKAILGAILGGLVGGIVTVILYMVGYMASLSGVVGALLGAYLYKRFGGKTNWVKGVAVGVSALVMVLASYHIMLLIEVAGVSSQAGITLGEGLGLVFADTEFVSAYASEVAMLVLFTLIGVGVVVYNIVREIKRVNQYYAGK